MKRIDKQSAINAIVISILLFTAMINWNIYSWLILVGIILVLFGWYVKK